jgi:hypothetical protein
MASSKLSHAASTLQIVATLVGAIFIVTFVLYGLNSQSDVNGTTSQAAAPPATPQQPASSPKANKQAPQGNQTQQQAQSQQGGGQQPSHASQPSAANNASTTTGQRSDPQGSPGANAGKNDSKTTPPAKANTPTPTNALPPKQTGNQ